MSDPMWVLLSLAAVFAATSVFSYKRSLRYLHYFQQEDYLAGRFLQWLEARRALDQKASPWAAVGALASFLLSPFGAWLGFLASIAAALCIFLAAKREEDPRLTGKLPLNMTARAKRILYLSLILSATLNLAVEAWLWIRIETGSGTVSGTGSGAGASALAFFWILQIFVYQLLPLMLIVADRLLTPYEKRLQERFADEARAKIKLLHPTTIGITGSYGKTSTKVILMDVLNSIAPTFTTPRSINSYMGVTREIRERLKAQHRYAIIEMGAYQTGSIKRMCSLTPPDAAIVTAVGEMHLERFGSREKVYQAKSELAQAVPENGILVVNGDYDYCRKMAEANRKKVTLIYGLDSDKGPLDAWMHGIEVSEKGTSFAIQWQGAEYHGFTQVLGRPMLSNVLAAFTMASALGLDPQLVLAVLRNVKTESNRLEPVRASISSLSLANGRAAKEGTVLRLNDAFNSNPAGFAGALEVLAAIKGTRKILVTPGMVELGESQANENKKAAEKAASICDLVVVVGSTNRDALVDGLKDGGLASEKWKEVPSMKDAFKFLAADYCGDGDVVLIENDLPDLYESIPTF